MRNPKQTEWETWRMAENVCEYRESVERWVCVLAACYGTRQPAAPGAVCDVANKPSKISGMFSLCSPQMEMGNLVTHRSELWKSINIVAKVRHSSRQRIPGIFPKIIALYAQIDLSPSRAPTAWQYVHVCSCSVLYRKTIWNTRITFGFCFFSDFFCSVFASCTNCKMRSSAARNN